MLVPPESSSAAQQDLPECVTPGNPRGFSQFRHCGRHSVATSFCCSCTRSHVKLKSQKFSAGGGTWSTKACIRQCLQWSLCDGLSEPLERGGRQRGRTFFAIVRHCLVGETVTSWQGAKRPDTISSSHVCTFSSRCQEMNNLDRQHKLEPQFT